MPLPASFLRAGFVERAEITKTRRLMIGCDGPPDSGKSEFAMSAPSPSMHIVLDRGIDGALHNPNPPKSRRPDIGFKVVQVPKATQMTQPQYVEYWKKFYNEAYLVALNTPECRTVVIDGDTDSWELQRLAEFGRLSKVPSNLYDNVNAARRAMYSRAYDSGKIVIATNRTRKEYVTKTKADGTPELNSSGNEVRIWSGEYERQGFSDQEFLWTVQLRHYFNEETQQWGIRIMKCKPDRRLIGMTLEGEDCCFAGLVQTVYPHIPLREWGL